MEVFDQNNISGTFKLCLNDVQPIVGGQHEILLVRALCCKIFYQTFCIQNPLDERVLLCHKTKMFLLKPNQGEPNDYKAQLGCNHAIC